MTLPRRHHDRTSEPSAGPHVDEIVERNIQRYEEIANEIVERLQKDIPASHLDGVVETALYRFGRLVSDRNRAINEAALKQEQVPHQQQPVTDQPQLERDRRRLKQWFRDHLAYPYPTNEEKDVLALECHMSLRQVSNWFINVRMRIWTPIVRKYGLEIPERTLFERSPVVLPDEAIREIRKALNSDQR